MEIPPWKLSISIICSDLCKYKKSETDPVYIILNCCIFTDYTYIFTGGWKDGNKRTVADVSLMFIF